MEFVNGKDDIPYRWDGPGDPETGKKGGLSWSDANVSTGSNNFRGCNARPVARSMFIPNSSDVIDALNFIHKKGEDWIGGVLNEQIQQAFWEVELISRATNLSFTRVRAAL